MEEGLLTWHSAHYSRHKAKAPLEWLKNRNMNLPQIKTLIKMLLRICGTTVQDRHPINLDVLHEFHQEEWRKNPAEQCAYRAGAVSLQKN